MSSYRQPRPPGYIQGPSEDCIYRLDTTGWGGSPTVIQYTVTKSSDSSDVTSSVVQGGLSVEGDDILIRLAGLSAGELYVVTIDFQTPEQPQLSTYFNIKCE